MTAADGMTLAAATEAPDSTLVGADAGELAGVGKLGVLVSHSLTKVVDDFDVVIDFTGPTATMVHLDVCRKHGKAMVIGTTGLSEANKGRDQCGGQGYRHRLCPQHERRCESVFFACSNWLPG